MEKKIIFIGNVFYDYHKIITNKLNEIIGETLFFPEQRSGWLFKILNNLNPKLVSKNLFLFYLDTLKKRGIYFSSICYSWL